MWGARIGAVSGLWLLACGPAAPTSATVEVRSDGMSAQDVTLSLHLRSGGSETRGDGHLDVWIDGPSAPTSSSVCHLGVDVTAAQFRGSDGLQIVVPFPPGCDATLAGRTPPYAASATFTTSDGRAIETTAGLDVLIGARLTYREPTPVAPPPPPPPPATTITTASCNAPIAGACEEWTLPADQLVEHQTTCSGQSSTWSLAPCPLAGALGRCVMTTETLYSYVTLDGAEDQCTRFGGQFTTLP